MSSEVPPFGIALTAEELSCVPLLVGGECSFGAAIGIAAVGEVDSVQFDLGVRILTVRQLVNPEGDKFGVASEVCALGEYLIDPSDVWVIGVATPGFIDTVTLISRGDEAIALLPGPPGIYSYRPVEANLPKEVAALLSGVLAESAAQEAESTPDAVTRPEFVVQKLYPTVGAPIPIRVDESGSLEVFMNGEMSFTAVEGLAELIA